MAQTDPWESLPPQHVFTQAPEQALLILVASDVCLWIQGHLLRLCWLSVPRSRHCVGERLLSYCMQKTDEIGGHDDQSGRGWPRTRAHTHAHTHTHNIYIFIYMTRPDNDIGDGQAENLVRGSPDVFHFFFPIFLYWNRDKFLPAGRHNKRTGRVIHRNDG